MADFMPMVHAERRALAEYLAELTPQQWQAQTPCAKWNVQQLTGHLVAAAKITAPHFFAGLIKSGFSFDKFIEGDLAQYAEGSPADVLARFTSILDSNRKPPGPAYVAFGEIMVHGEDIRRATGTRGDYKDTHLIALADAYKATGAPLNGKKRVAGLKFTATDVGWTTGSGPEVQGPCMSLIRAMTGRADGLTDCTGDGVETLRSRQ
jgi:uncharacterized protein (TIGR03083 family)